MSEIELFQPSNSDHGFWFMRQFCDQCAKFPHSSDAKKQCNIFLRTMAYSTSDPEYPKEWRYTEDGPVCTAFTSREEFNAKRRAARKRFIATDKDTIDLFGSTGK